MYNLNLTITQLSSLAKWLSMCLRTKWLWVRITLLSNKPFVLIKQQSKWNYRQPFFNLPPPIHMYPHLN